MPSRIVSIGATIVLAKKCLEVDAGSNKYILSTGCQIPLNAPLDQVKHFIDAAQEYGIYG